MALRPPRMPIPLTSRLKAFLGFLLYRDFSDKLMIYICFYFFCAFFASFAINVVYIRQYLSCGYSSLLRIYEKSIVLNIKTRLNIHNKLCVYNEFIKNIFSFHT